MRTATAHERHRAQHIRVARAGIVFALLGGCGGPALPRPPVAAVDAGDYIAVPSSPRPPPVEFVPARPDDGRAVWVDGTWEWSGERYGWLAGTWTIPPDGARLARWVVVRRKEDGQLFFAPSGWRDAANNALDESPWIHALGPNARARSRLGGPPPTPEVSRPERTRRRSPANADGGAAAGAAADGGVEREGEE